MKRLNSRGDLEALRSELHTLRQELIDKKRLRVCCGTGCQASGAMKVVDIIEKEREKQGLDFDIIKTGCQGLCEKGPLAILEPEGIFHQRVTPKGAIRILSPMFGESAYTGHLLYRDPVTGEPILAMEEIPFYKKQKRLVLLKNGRIDPCDIRQYIALGGYSALQKVLEGMDQDEVIGVIKDSGLRGRGGAGFPTGRKWEAGKKAKGEVKYVICNGDEGDPGAFMDRSILEGDPHSVLEGMTICAYAIGAEEGFIYVRHEYPLACKNLRVAIDQAEELGLLGKNILGSGFNFSVEIKEGAGAFVCGESTALTESIEGKRGMPKASPRARTTDQGLFGKPTVLNNVETFANVPIIINEGVDFYRSIGTEGSPGTKVFALTGKIKNTGLIEVPMGITLREIIFDIGGGILNDKEFKAVQTGGPSGGCLPAEYLDLPVDFDTLTEAGSMMGSGGMVVMDEDDCMVEVARFFLQFTQQESCGKCPPCRIGTYQMLEILNRMTTGAGQEGDIELLLDLGEKIIETSVCGLGQSAPNPVLSTIKYFRSEYEAHIREKWCPAKVCRGLGSYRIVEKECVLCGFCKDACPENAIVEERSRFYIDQDYCTKCKTCLLVCPIGAVAVEKERKYAKERTRV
jgi:NADH-quinone oxidoreductase subunit F/NADP-reducing hydrogenase subunit HndC